tara:strand:+ start:111 stop:2516 length:2406 start_codon:yes stop_codon:yes gene_type:complete
MIISIVYRLSHYFRKPVTLFPQAFLFKFYPFQNLWGNFKTYIMKKIILLLALTVLALKVQGQIEFEGAPEYGRLYNITYDPTVENKLYALTIGNHLMTSTDNGLNWDIQYTFPNHIVMLKDLKYRSDHTLSFIVDGTADLDGVYIFDIETNSIIKEYIAPIPPDSYRDWIATYSVFENDSNIAILHQSYMDQSFSAFSKVYYTTNGGHTWEEIYYNVNFGGVHPNNVAISPSNPNKLYIPRGAGPNNIQGGLLISDDAGANWTESLAGTYLKPIVFQPDNADIMWMGTFISDGVQPEQLFKSTDGGQTWETADITWSPASLNCINTIIYNPQDLNNILVLEENEIVISNDGGDTWTNYVYPENEPETYTFGFYASFNPFVFDEVFITADYYPMHSTDGGATINILPIPFNNTSMVGLAPQSQNHLYYSVQDGIVHRDFTNGETSSFYINPIDIFSINNPTRYFIDENTLGRIYSFTDSAFGAFLDVSNDHGETRNMIYQTFFDDIRAIAPLPNNHNKIWVSMRDAGLLSFDFSDFNQVIETPIQVPETGIVYEIYFNETNPSEVWIGINNRLYRSMDGGAAWEVKDNGITLPMDGAIYNMIQHPNNTSTLMVATSHGIFKTVDGGEQWEQVLNERNVQKIAYSPFNADVIVASIYSSDIAEAQILFSTDGGQTWTGLPVENIANVLSFAMDYFFYESSADIYLATNDLGVIKVNIDLSVLGTPQAESSSANVIYPNPTQDLLYIKAAGGTFMDMELYDSLGKRVFKARDTTTLSLGHLKGGIYFLKLTTSEGLFIKRIIKE